MVYQDFTTYEEVDPNEHITRTASRVTFTDLTNPESAYVYKDKGAGHFTGDFEHKLDTLHSSMVRYSYVDVWALSNSIGDRNESGNCINVFWYGMDAGLTRALALQEKINGALFTDYSIGLSVDTPYYLTIKRVAATLTCEIYSDSDRTNLVDTLTLILHAVLAYRYIYACRTLTEAGLDYAKSGYMENLDIGFVAFKQTVAEKLGMVDAVVPKTAYHVTATEKLGLVDAVKPVRGVHVTVAETLGLKDAVAKKAAYKKTVAEKLGLLDDVVKKKAMYVAVAEKLGLVDDYFKRVTAGILGDNPDNVGSRGGPIYKDMPDYMGAVYVNTKNTWQDAENLDDVHGYTSYMWIPEETFKVKLMKLHVYAEKFRAYSKTTETVLPKHRHDVYIGTTTSGGSSMWTSVYLPLELITRAAHETIDPESTLYSFSAIVTSYYTDICEKAHTHGINYGTKTSEEGGKAHKHEIDFGIWEDEEIAGRTLSAVLYDPKGNELEKWDPLTTGEMDVILDLTEYFKDLKYGMYRLELKASGRIRVRLVYYELGIMFAM